MSNSLKERIVGSLIVGAFLFMFYTVMYKLIIPREDWLAYSIMWSISWAIGAFVSKTIAEATEDLSIIKVILIDALISIVVGFVIAFITGVLISLSNWDYIVSNTCIPFAISMLLNNKRKRD